MRFRHIWHFLFKSFIGISAGLKFMGTIFFLIVWILMRRQDRRDLQLNLPVSSIQKHMILFVYTYLYSQLKLQLGKALLWKNLLCNNFCPILPYFWYGSAGLLKFIMLCPNRIFQIIFPISVVIFVKLSLNIFHCWDGDNK